MKLYHRENYLKNIRGFYHETDLIKVITGIRRCGKSCLMQSIAEELIASGVKEENIIYINLDKRGYKSIQQVARRGTQDGIAAHKRAFVSEL